MLHIDRASDLAMAPELAGRPSSAAVSVNKIVKTFGDTPVLGGGYAGAGIDLDIRRGEFMTLVGPSGCGKSTLLRIIAGLIPQDGGEVRIGGNVVDDLPPSQRNIAMVFQSYALYPHLTAFENIAMPLTMQRLWLPERLPIVKYLSPRRARIMADIRAQVMDVARQLDIVRLIDRKPAQLSGGQRQRVALGRAMVRQPSVFLMDEPLSNLDAKLRVHMRAELAELHRRLGTTFIYVTHDQTEAMTMSDRVAMMDGGVIRQLGTPAELYDTPNDVVVARFIGSPPINLISVEQDGSGRLHHGAESLSLAVRADAGAVTLGVRPEHLTLTSDLDDARPGLKARVQRRENLGSEWFVHLRLDHLRLQEQEPTTLIARLSADDAPAIADGAATRVLVDARKAHIFDGNGRRIPDAGLSARDGTGAGA